MKLLFIYIENFRNIKGQGFNLSSSFDIDLIKKPSNGTSGTLTIRSINPDSPHLFDKSITDVKAIVGENGAGKSNLLHFLAFECHERSIQFGDAQALGSDLIVYSIDENDTQIRIAAGPKWRQKLQWDNQSKAKEIQFLIIERDNLDWNEILDFDNTSVIHYSNVFDVKQETSSNGLINISTNYLVHADSEKIANNQFHISNVIAHRLMEFRRQLHFAIFFKDKIPFEIPKTICIEASNFSAGLIQQFKDKLEANIGDGDLINKWQELTKDAFTYKIDYPPNLQSVLRNSYLNYFIYNSILNYSSVLADFIQNYRAFLSKAFQKIIELYQKDGPGMDLNYLQKFLFEEEQAISRNFVSSSGKPIANFTIGDSSLATELQRYINFERALTLHSGQVRPLGNTTFEIELTNNTDLIVDSYAQTIHLIDYLYFYLPNLSSGQLGFLTLFSRFFYTVDRRHRTSNTIDEHKTNLLILIDEGDLYFHPQWQMQFVFYTNAVLPLIFPDKKLQIILTSHSQFVVSDLPKNNLLFLKRKNDHSGECEVVSGPKATFAANVHTLLTDSFFIEGAHIGEFAKTVLHKVLDQIEGKLVSDPFSTQELMQVIEMVGEPWVRNQLYEKFLRNQNRLI